MPLYIPSSVRTELGKVLTSNVLLDEEMNPKLLDLGLARLFDGGQSQDKTHKRVGTLQVPSST